MNFLQDPAFYYTTIAAGVVGVVLARLARDVSDALGLLRTARTQIGVRGHKW